MGSMISSQMDAVMTKQMEMNQEFMFEMQKIQTQRQLAMQDQIRKRQMAMQIAGSRDMFAWYASFYSIAAIGLIVGARRAKNRAYVGPLVPLTFVLLYQADLAYGNKIDRIRAEAERLMSDETHYLELPHGMPTFKTLEEARKAANPDK